MKLVNINSNKCDQSVLDALKESMEIAERSPIKNCIVIMVSDEEVFDTWANNNLPYMTIGALEALKLEFVENNIEKR